MKKTVSIMALATLMVPAMAMAQPGRDHHDDHPGPAMHGPAMRGPAMRGPDHPPAGWHRFRRGERFDRAHAWNYREIDYRHYRGLRAPPRGYRWVRNGNDAVLVAISTGIVASVIAGAIAN